MIADFIHTHRWRVAVFGTSALLILGGFAWAFLSLRHIREPLIIHFSDFSITETGSVIDLWYVAIVALIAVGVNFFLSLEMAKRSALFEALIGWATLFLSLLIFIGFRVIISVNLVR
ncbi:MAG: hypothetical protein HY435_01905 [Candidatus Liptonbacteria bacterium]|nr:hypothetical protein [Candidatus Liptonbacteria bacterium]